MKKITLKELAEMAGVSMMTVSNVIRGNDARVSAKTKAKIQALIEKYHYVPNQNASNLRSGKSNLIGVLFYTNNQETSTDFTDPFVSALLTGISRTAEQNGYFIMIHSVRNPQNIETLQKNWRFAGFIIVGASSHDFLKIDAAIATPVSYIDTYYNADNQKQLPDKPRNFISTDEAQISKTIGDYLAKMGHEKILFFSFDFNEKEPSVIQKRYQAFKENFSGQFVQKSVTTADYQEILYSVREYLTAQPFTAIYATADILAVKLNQIFKDLSIIGVDNAEFTEFSSPKLTTVAIDQVKKGEVAIERLLESIEQGTSSFFELGSSLIERDSVRKLK